MKNKVRGKQTGLTLIELMLAMTMLAVGLLGVALLTASAIAGNSRANKDTGSTMVAQAVLERIAAVPADKTPAPVVSVTDCSGTARSIATAAGGAPLTASGDIDWTAAAVANYSMQYVNCGPAGQQTSFNVRWNVVQGTGGVSSFNKLITVSARPIGANTTSPVALRLFVLPVTLRTISGT